MTKQIWTIKPCLSQIQTGVSTTRLPVWNPIPSNIRSKPSLASFKKTMFDHFKDSNKHLDPFIF